MKGFKIIFYIILALSAMLTRVPPLTGTKRHRIWYRLYKERLFVCPPCFSLVEHLILILQRQRYTLSQIYICDISEKIPLLFLFVQCQIYSLHHVEIPQCHHTIPQPRYKSNIRSVFFSWGCCYVRLGGSQGRGVEELNSVMWNLYSDFVKNKMPFKPYANAMIKGTDIDSDLISTHQSIEISFLNSLSIFPIKESFWPFRPPYPSHH